MKNVYEIKREKCLDYILPKEKSIFKLNTDIFQFIIVVIHIYYYDRINMYLNYIENIPDDIFIFITVSEEKTQKYISCYLKDKAKKYKVVMKENRGRDISSLLVAARKEILKYKYVCFIHDKKEKNPNIKDDIEQWNYCLWENSLGSRSFIKNIIYTFEKNSNLGLLVPPSPITENLEFGYSNSWGDDFELMQRLAHQMNLNCDLKKSFPPVALGTVFWARTKALESLFLINWKYDNFEPEPLPEDGTISHAIERSLPYVAQDAGYETGWVMTDRYAAEQWEYHIDLLKTLFGFLENTQKTILISKVRRLVYMTEQLPYFCQQYQKIYIYGAGQIARQCFAMMVNLNISIESFLVSRVENNDNKIYGILVQSIEKVILDETCGIIIATGTNFINEIQNKLLSKNILEKNIFVFG